MIISAGDIHKIYTMKKGVKTHVLKGIDFEMERSEYVAVMGPSGAGKSTLLHIIGTIDYPDKGEVEFLLHGESIRPHNLDEKKLSGFRNKNIGFVFQQYHLLPEFSAIENVMMPALIAGMAKKQAKDKAAELIERVGVSHRLDHKPSELSGGEAQRISIARALVNSPEVILADEPTGNLDEENSAAVLDLIRKLRDDYGLTFLTATHNLDVASRADRIVRIRDGVIE